MTIIAPSLLSANFLELKTELERLNSIDDLWLHLDVMDSHFVPNLTFGEPVLNKLHKISKHPLDAHFMVTNPYNPSKDGGVVTFSFKDDRLIKIHWAYNFC